MSPGALTILVMAALLVTLLTGLPVAFCLFGLSALFILILLSPTQMVTLFTAAFSVGTKDIYIAIALFVLMAAFLQYSGMASALYNMMYKWFGGVRGGLAMGTVILCTIIAAMTGLAATGVVTIGALAYPEMMKRGYDKRVALGCIPPAGSLGPLIPPSVAMVIIGGFANLSIAKLFIGGLFPGLFMSALFLVYIGIKCWRQPELAPALPLEERATWNEKLIALRGVIAPIILILVVLGSIYTGAATPTEAAGVGAFGAFIIAAIYRRLSWENLKKALLLTLRVNAMVMWLLIAGTAFSTLLGLIGVRHFVAETLTGLAVAPIVIIIIMQLVVLIMGMFMDQAAITVICIPIFVPVVLELGFDPLWFCLVFALNYIIAFVTPPFGIGLFYTKGIVPPDVTMMEIYRSVIPYIGLMLIVLVTGFLWPPLLTWLPGMMMK